MTNPHGRRIQARRATAILAWGALVLLAVLLRYARVEGLMRGQVWEPAAMILSAFIGFLSLFCWLLFSPQRGTVQEESPAVFFAGMLTLIPPGFIAWYLMPPASPLRAWVALGVVIFGVLAILSPIPEALFRIPRDRRTYLRPVTDATLSLLDVDAPEARFENIVPRTQFRLTGQPPVADQAPVRDEARDPWQDPFRGTGRQLSRVVPGESRARAPVTSDSKSVKAAVPIARSVAEQYPIVGSTVPETVDVDSRGISSAAGGMVAVPSGNALSGTLTSVDSLGARESTLPVGDEVAERRPLRDPEAIRPAAHGAGAQRAAAESSVSPAQARGVDAVTPVTPSGGAAVVTAATAAKVATGAITAAAGIGFGMASAGAARAASLVKSVVRRGEASVPVARPVAPLAGATGPVVEPVATSTGAVAQRVGSQSASVAATPSLQELDRILRDEFREADDPSVVDTTVGVGSGQRVDDLDGHSDIVPAETIRLERTTEESGVEIIEGAAIASFAIGQKRVNLHIPLSPPMAGVPVVECEQAGEESLRLRVAVRQPYGFRIEARRTEASTMLEAEVLFSAVYTPAHRV